MKKLSGFDLGVVIAFAVITLAGGGAWWYLSGGLQDAQDQAKSADNAFNKYSVAKGGQESIVVSPQNAKTLQANIDAIKTQLDPLIQAKLLQKENKLRSIDKEDPVAWKHDLDDEVHRLSSTAKVRGVALPPNFYFSFSRYLNQNPGDEQTAVLSKQLVGVEQIATILINAPVKSIRAIRRTYEEEPHSATNTSTATTAEGDRVGGFALHAPGNDYTAYPFEVDFDATPENLRIVTDRLIQSPYIFIVRTLSIQNSSPNSPRIDDLDKLADVPSSSVVNSSPGEVAATTSTKGPQFLFGNSTLKVRARIDMIEWTGTATAEANR